MSTSQFGSGFSAQAAAARLIYGMGRDNVLPRRIFGTLSPRSQNPARNILIVGVFAFTMGARRLSEREGRLLKLMSGLMMLQLGILLMLAPDWLNRLGVAFALLGVALGATWLAARLTRA